MHLYSAPNPAPNPRRVRIFLAEKGVHVPTTDLSLVKGEHKAPAFLAKNSRGQVPALELDDGTVIAETIAICRYFDALHPEPALFGGGPKAQALVEMWVRRVEFVVMQPAGLFWVHAHPLTARLVRQHTEFGESNRAHYLKALAWLETELAKAGPFVAGDAFTVADIALLTTVDFAHWIGLPIPEDAPALRAWHAHVSARPSAAA